MCCERIGVVRRSRACLLLDFVRVGHGVGLS